MSVKEYFTDYIQDTARMAVIKARAAYPCKHHPDTLILSNDTDKKNRAYQVAINTLVYNDKKFLEKYVIEAVSYELSCAYVQCVQCLQYLQD